MFDFKINRRLLPVKGHLFLWNGGLNLASLLMPVYAAQLGFSSFVVGIVFMILPFSAVLTSLTLGAIADKYKCQKRVFLIVQFFAAVAYFSMIFLPEAPSTAKTDVTGQKMYADLKIYGSEDNATVKRFENEICCQLNSSLSVCFKEIGCKNWRNKECCGLYLKSNLLLICCFANPKSEANSLLYCKATNLNLENENNSITKSTVKDTPVVGLYQFWLLMIVYLVGWCCKTVTVSLGDTICFQVLDGKPHRYGYQMVWGSLGSGIVAIIVGFSIDGSSTNGDSQNYTPAFLTAVSAMLLSILVSCFIRFTQQHTSSSILKDVGRLLVNFRIIIFLLWCACVGLCTGLSWYFLFWLLEDLAAAYSPDVQARIKTIEGLVVAAQCFVGDLPFFFVSGWMSKKIGHVQCMNLVLLAIGIKFTLYSLLINPWWSLAVECLHGPTFGLLYATMVSYSSIVAPPGAEATTQALVSTAFKGVGMSLGSFLGGLSFEQFGGSMTFRIVGIFALVACTVHASVQSLMTMKRNKSDTV